MTDHELPCLHCVVSRLIEKHIPEELYPFQEKVRGMVEVTLDMIASANPREQQGLYVSASVFLAEGFRDIMLGHYKGGTKAFFNDDETTF